MASPTRPSMDLQEALDEFARISVKVGAITQTDLEELLSGTTPVAALNTLIEYHSSPEVRIVGLKSKPEFNGQLAHIVGPRSGERWPVKPASPPDAPPMLLQPANLRPGTDGEPPHAVLKGALGADLAQAIGSFLTCARCLEPCSSSGGRCRVPHPQHMRQDAGSMFNGSAKIACYHCSACDASFRAVSDFTDGNGSGEAFGPERIEGAEWCFDGRHSSIPLAPGDSRRVFPHAAYLTAGPRLQAQIDALPRDTVILHISNDHGYEQPFVLDLDALPEGAGASGGKDGGGPTARLPQLKELQLEGVAFSRIRLSGAGTPALAEVSLQNIGDDCELSIELPSLKEFTIRFWHGDDDEINALLAAAPRLERFRAYKLWVHSLQFASNALTEIDLHRSDSLHELTIWAPLLATLNLQACYGLASIRFLPTHALAAELPLDHKLPTYPLVVTTVNANLGSRARAALRAHPRVAMARAEQTRGMPTEGMFANMQTFFAGMGGMMPGMFGGGGASEGEEGEEEMDWSDEDEDEDDEADEGEEEDDEDEGESDFDETDEGEEEEEGEEEKGEHARSGGQPRAGTAVGNRFSEVESDNEGVE